MLGGNDCPQPVTSTSSITAPEPSGGYGLYRSNDNGVSWSKISIPLADGESMRAYLALPDGSAPQGGWPAMLANSCTIVDDAL